MKVRNGHRGRVSVAALLVVVMALSGARAFADGGGSEPLPKPTGRSFSSEVYEAASSVFGAVSFLMDLMY
jgi:hypothetical protein